LRQCGGLETSGTSDPMTRRHIPEERRSHKYRYEDLETGTFIDLVEIPTRWSFVIEFLIPKFIEGSTCFERHTAHHQEL